jgi:hypothetical protein
MVFIIAEACVNFRDLVDADQLIKAASDAGADAIKFQLYKEEHVNGHPREQELKNIILSESDVRFLYWRCQQHNIEFMATPFYSDAVRILDPFVKRWKVRYADRMNHDILQKCIDTGKEILCSEESPKINDQIKSLYCCSEYPPGKPARFADVEGFDGYSCHIPAIRELIGLIIGGAKIDYLEVHVRLDHYEPHYCPIDNAVSITMSELAELCRRLKK